MNATRTCSVEGCEAKHYGHGYCQKHWNRWRDRASGDVVTDREKLRGDCTIPGCTRPHQARGWCKIHWQRWKRTGSPLDPVVVPWHERFWAKVRKTETCWLWTGVPSTRGYGTFFCEDGKTRGAHVISWEIANGRRATPGMVIGHKCHDDDLTCTASTKCAHRMCVNPEHLAEMTIGENVRAGFKGRHLVNEDPESLASTGCRIEIRRLG